MWQQLIDAVDHFRQGWYCGYDHRIGCISNNVAVGVELERFMLAKAPLQQDSNSSNQQADGKQALEHGDRQAVCQPGTQAGEYDGEQGHRGPGGKIDVAPAEVRQRMPAADTSDHIACCARYRQHKTAC